MGVWGRLSGVSNARELGDMRQHDLLDGCRHHSEVASVARLHHSSALSRWRGFRPASVDSGESGEGRCAGERALFTVVTFPSHTC